MNIAARVTTAKALQILLLSMWRMHSATGLGVCFDHDENMDAVLRWGTDRVMYRLRYLYSSSSRRNCRGETARCFMTETYALCNAWVLLVDRTALLLPLMLFISSATDRYSVLTSCYWSPVKLNSSTDWSKLTTNWLGPNLMHRRFIVSDRYIHARRGSV